MKESLVQFIGDRLEKDINYLNGKFTESISEVGVRYFTVDNLLPSSVAHEIFAAFPSHESMRLMNSFRERKYTSKNFDKFNRLMADITFAFQDSRIVKLIEKITCIYNQVPDPSLYAGGLSAMGRAHFLGPHLDNSHDGDRNNYRTLNLLYYVTPDWKVEYGGNLELWDSKVRNSITIPSAFNRLVVMETKPWSWHSVSEVEIDRMRCCVSNYYFSPFSPTGNDYFNITAFSARPEQKVRRIVMWGDNKLRTAIRLIKPNGLGKNDIYRNSNK